MIANLSPLLLPSAPFQLVYVKGSLLYVLIQRDGLDSSLSIASHIKRVRPNFCIS